MEGFIFSAVQVEANSNLLFLLSEPSIPDKIFGAD